MKATKAPTKALQITFNELDQVVAACEARVDGVPFTPWPLVPAFYRRFKERYAKYGELSKIIIKGKVVEV